MLTFLFWNINRKPLQDLVVALAREHQVDVLILAECDIPPQLLLELLNSPAPAEFHLPFSQCEQITVFTRFPRQFLTPIYEARHISIRRLTLPIRVEVLLVAVHFPSKMFWREASQQAECYELATTISEQERIAGHSRTVLVGDLNMNPFETGMVAANGIHGIMTRQVAARGTRTVQDREYTFFYNPMWACFGDGTPGPPGTYYYDRAEHVTYFWNVFDQVLLRPELMDRFSNENVTVLTSAGGASFLKKDGRIDGQRASDHLPLLFKLDL